MVGFGAGDDSDFIVEAVLLVVAAGLEVDYCWGPTAVDMRVEVFFFVLVEVGAGVRGLVFEHFHEAVEAGGEEGAKDGSDPVDLGFCGLVSVG